MGNTSSCLSLDGTLSNTLAMKLLIRNRTTPYCKFRPSLISPHPSPPSHQRKKTRHLVTRETIFKYTVNSPTAQWKKVSFKLEREKIESHYFL